MKIEISTFWVQKDGNKTDEYEDAFWFSTNPKQCVVAMSDGATEASFSQRLAQILTRGFIENVPDCWTTKRGKRSYNFLQWLRPLQKEWFAGVDFSNLPWFAVEKAQQGAAASLLGLVINLEKGYWQATAVGDTNLFILREGKIFSWPLWKYEQFGSSPYIAWSNPAKNAMTAKALKTTGGRVQSGDIFFLMTHALAAFCLKTACWDACRCVINCESQMFSEFVDTLRSTKELKNDDTTLVVVKIKEV